MSALNNDWVEQPNGSWTLNPEERPFYNRRVCRKTLQTLFVNLSVEARADVSRLMLETRWSWVLPARKVLRVLHTAGVVPHSMYGITACAVRNRSRCALLDPRGSFGHRGSESL